ncbi:MAG: hypothetical protein JRI23_02815 [Deltaproteobacteria bacterium]|jgi:pyruvate,water dikinase|nr:hypothetical protein [Deltaproteobacteria bacterium]MBW2530437.1 hypothetical protein [Deltaproteobacteria bacterium]
MAPSVPLIQSLAELGAGDERWVGGKAARLGNLIQEGYEVPAGACILARAYQQFLAETGLGPRIQILLHRKRFEDMRWEELWDLALRIRNLFLRTELPEKLSEAIVPTLDELFGVEPVVVRSSGLGEDSGERSFAGLHDSFVDVRGVRAIVESVRRVWASLWSDRALLYRKELGLDPAASAIAVVVQQLVSGEASGVHFTKSPVEPDECIVEAVWGLNQGLVDGTVEPDRWHLDRKSGALRKHLPATRPHALGLGPVEPTLVPLEPHKQQTPPLEPEEVTAIWTLGQRLEGLFGAPQDVEWTKADGRLVLLQARPITSASTAEDDSRRWYLSLHRSLESLQALRTTIEQEVLPGMAAEADALGTVDLGALDERALADEIRRRQTISQGWIDTYWRECIPFAHGVRLFGQIYNDRMAPADPFEFVELLQDTELLAQRRNVELAQLAALWQRVAEGRAERTELEAAADRFIDRHGLSFGTTTEANRQGLERLLQELTRSDGDARPQPAPDDDTSPAARRSAFLERFAGSERESMAALVDLARASYRLRDDDNIYLGRIHRELDRALEHGRRRLADRGTELPTRVDPAEVIHALEDPSFSPSALAAPSEPAQRFEARARQLVGQPASPGLSSGPARVVRQKEDLFAVTRGDVLVCDSLDPTMTLVAPLVAAIVERRGGMLIHGAIIAREYGVPCVTGVPDVLRWITDGDRVTVDGHVGLVTIATRQSSPP